MSDGKWIVRDGNRGSERQFDDRAEAEETLKELKDIVASSGGDARDVQLIPPDDSSNTTDVDVEDHTADARPAEAEVDGGKVTTATEQLPDDGPSVDEDPLTWMPEEFTDTIDGTVAINRKGFEVLAHHYDIACTTELVTNPVDMDESVIVEAEATDSDGTKYSAYGSASVSRDDDAGLLVEMADTRAFKRAVSRATGVGTVAVEELQSEL
jgi:hypothetical protein